MKTLTSRLNQAFLSPLTGHVTWNSELNKKPICANLTLPYPPKLRIYMYSLVGGFGTVRPEEYKAVLRVPGQAIDAYGGFDHSDGRVVLVIGYSFDLDVFVLWDSSLHLRFKNGGNIQVRESTVFQAVIAGRATQKRILSGKAVEVVIACQSASLLQAIDDRVSWTGSV